MQVIICREHLFSSIGSESPNQKIKDEQSCVRIGDNTQIREFVTINRSIGMGRETLIGSHCRIIKRAYKILYHSGLEFSLALKVLEQ